MKTIITYGLYEKQLTLLEAALPEGYRLQQTDCYTDLIVTDSVLTLIDTDTVSKEGMRALLAYYMDVGDRLNETVVWLGTAPLPHLPSFSQKPDFLQFLLSCDEILQQAQVRYDTLQGYTDIYSYLPRHAISECLEADFYAALRQNPVCPLSDARKLWSGVLELEKGAELLAAVWELCRWLQQKHIPYRMACNPRWNTFVQLFQLVEIAAVPETAQEFEFSFSKENLLKVQAWLQHHWYFRSSTHAKISILQFPVI